MVFMAKAPAAVSARLPHRDHRTRRPAHRAFGDTSSERVRAPRTAVRAENDGVDATLLGRAHDHFLRVAGFDSLGDGTWVRTGNTHDELVKLVASCLELVGRSPIGFSPGRHAMTRANEQ